MLIASEDEGQDLGGMEEEESEMNSRDSLDSQLLRLEMYVECGNIPFGKLFRSLRKRFGATQKELARICGVTYVYICMIENSVVIKPRPKVVSRLLKWVYREKQKNGMAS